MNKNILSIVVGVLASFFLLVLADFVPFWMPMMGELVMVVGVAVCMVLFVGLILQEDTHDEREMVLKLQSGRYAYASGLIVLLTALVAQGLMHTIDPWIPVALLTMVITKLVTRAYLE